MEETKTNSYLATEPIGKLILKFSVPCVLSMLVSALYNIVDQIFIGQSVGYFTGKVAERVIFILFCFEKLISILSVKISVSLSF